jgi:sugar lactone lactonase YvrE
MAWSPENKYIYYNDSYGLIAWRFDFGTEAGTISNRIDFVDLRKPGDSSSRTAK